MNRELFNYYLVPQMIKTLFIFMFTVDPALAIVERLNITPYSIIWSIINPFSNTQYTYKFYLLVADSIVSYVMWLRHVWIPYRRWLYVAWQLTQLHWFTGFYQNVSVTWFATILPLSPLLLKLPWGWSLSLDDSHIQCALNCSGGLQSVHLISNLVTYSLILFWSFLPLSLFIKDRLRIRKEMRK